MKKVIAFAIFVFSAYMFLTYAGVFRDLKNPLEVAKYYLECIKNREGFLVYSISKREYFDEDKNGSIYQAYQLYRVKKIKLVLSELKDNYAQVKASLVYGGGGCVQAAIALEKTGPVWLITNVRWQQS